mgnify:CR=1 FL=1
MSAWIVRELGTDVPLHFTAFHPDYKMMDLPRTPAATLTRARDIALTAGIRYVYTGNVHDRTGGTTFCPGCGKAAHRARLARDPELRGDGRRPLPPLRRIDPGAVRRIRRANGVGAGCRFA